MSDTCDSALYALNTREHTVCSTQCMIDSMFTRAGEPDGRNAH